MYPHKPSGNGLKSPCFVIASAEGRIFHNEHLQYEEHLRGTNNVNVKNLLADAKHRSSTHHFNDRLAKAVRQMLYANVAVAVGSSAFGFASPVQAAESATASANDDLEEVIITARRRAIISAAERK